MGQFDNVDLGNDKTMRRMVKAAQEQRNIIIEECAQYLVSKRGWREAAETVRELKITID